MYDYKKIHRTFLGVVAIFLVCIIPYSLSVIAVNNGTWLGLQPSWQYFFKIVPVFILVALTALVAGLAFGALLGHEPAMVETKTGVAVLADSTQKLALGLGVSGLSLVAKRIVDYAEKFAASVSLDPSATAIVACATLIIFSVLGIAFGLAYQQRSAA